MMHVEYRTWFIVNDREEADRLLDQLFDADEAVICPGTDAPWQTCTECAGTTIDPEQEDAEPGSCEYCRTERPGMTQPCVREHTSSATIHTDGRWLDAEDRRTLTMLNDLKTLIETDPQAALAWISERQNELQAYEQDMINAQQLSRTR